MNTAALVLYRSLSSWCTHAPTWPTHSCRLHGLIATGGLSESQDMEQIADLFHQSVQTGSTAPLLTLTAAEIRNRTEQRWLRDCLSLQRQKAPSVLQLGSLALASRWDLILFLFGLVSYEPQMFLEPSGSCTNQVNLECMVSLVRAVQTSAKCNHYWH